MDMLTIAEASNLTGLTRKALRRRIERGVINSTLDRRGLRRIPRGELERLDLVPTTTVPMGQGHPEVAQPAPAAPMTAAIDLSPLLARLEALIAENATLRQLEARTGSLEREVTAEREARERAENALFETRARLQELQAARSARRWWRRRRIDTPPSQQPGQV